MGWARGLNDEGREVGYGVESVCEQDGCGEKIDLGLAYCCGGLEAPTFGGDQGCGHYFCAEHLFFGPDFNGQRCPTCAVQLADSPGKGSTDG